MPKVPFPTGLTPLAGPIALVTTVDKDGRVNVAPKSWISYICRNPFLFVLGCHREHHTAANLLANGECVLNFPSDRLAGLTWDSHRFLAPSPDELALRGFTAVPAEKVAPPRLEQCRAHIEGRVQSVQWYGDESVFTIEQVACSADAEVAAAPDPYALIRPIFYTGPGTYGVIEGGHRAAEQGQGDDFVRYVVLLTPRAGMQATKPLIRAHVAHLRQLDAAGRLVLCGPFEGRSGGMAIIRAGSVDEARALAAADPFVVEQVYDVEVRTWHLSCEANNHMGYGD